MNGFQGSDISEEFSGYLAVYPRYFILAATLSDKMIPKGCNSGQVSSFQFLSFYHWYHTWDMGAMMVLILNPWTPSFLAYAFIRFAEWLSSSVKNFDWKWIVVILLNSAITTYKKTRVNKAQFGYCHVTVGHTFYMEIKTIQDMKMYNTCIYL